VVLYLAFAAKRKLVAANLRMRSCLVAPPSSAGPRDEEIGYMARRDVIGNKGAASLVVFAAVEGGVFLWGSSRPCGLVSGGIPADVPPLSETQASDAEKRLFDLIVVKKLFTFAFQDNAAIFQNVGAVTDG
jgi:hypothetical protein